jgi:phenylalanyl-tRNA synthetase beta chain
MKISYNWLKDYCGHELPASELAARLGEIGLCVETFEAVGDDWMLDVEVTTNRPDCLSHVGIAREVAALTGLRVRHPECAARAEPALKFEDLASVSVRCPDLCPHYTARVIKGVRVGPSPDWLQKRLITCGLRPINNVVDVTNYVLLEMGQPLHAFDLNLLAGRTIIVRRAAPGETMTTIDGVERALPPDACVIADAKRAVAVAGVMGGIDTEIRDSTTDVLIESARFDPVSIRRVSRALVLSTDSSYRFERGVDPEGVDRASERACRLILELAGGRLASGAANLRADSTELRAVSMRFKRLALVLGISVSPDEVRRIFEGQELEILKLNRNSVTVRVPSWRADLEREIDLIEEVARIHGYDKIAETTRMPVAPAAAGRRERCERIVRNVMVAAGFNEVMNYSLVTNSPHQLMQPWHNGQPIALRNPVSQDRTHLRLTTMPSLLAVKQFNAAHGTARIDVFEIGKIYLPQDSEDGRPREQVCLGALTDRKDGFYLLKGALANVLESLHIEEEIEEVPEAPAAIGPFDQERLLLKLDGETLGCIGVLSAGVAAAYDLGNRPALMEVNLDLLLKLFKIHPTIQATPRFPEVRRDVAVVVDETVRWREMERCIRENAPEHMQSVEFFDVYRGQQVAAGKKSIAFSLTFRAPDRTLTGAEADAGRDKVVAALKAKFAAETR